MSTAVTTDLDADVAGPAGPPAALSGVSKVFGGTVAVQDVSIELRAGEVLALVGENGAGKSTCVKMLGGLYRPDAGTVLLNGESVTLHSPLDAHRRGVAVVHQHPGLFPDLSITENVFAGQLPKNALGTIEHGRIRAEARTHLAALGLTRDPSTLVSALRTSEQQLVEFARALASGAKIIILDEPTAALTSGEVERLFDVVRSLRRRGVAMLFVGHRLDEIFAIADRIAVLRDGMLVHTGPANEIDQAEAVRMMVGRDIEDLYPHVDKTIGNPVLEVSGLASTGQFRGIDLTVRAGEVVGLAGLVGSGRTEVARALFGIQRPSAGTIVLAGKQVRLRSAADALSRGIAYLSEDRRGQSIIEDFAILDNATLPVISRTTRLGLIRRRLEIAQVSGPLTRMKLKFAAYEQPIGTLSGGNQQKVVLAKWLAASPQVLILDEPTQGVDIAAKSEVHRIISELAARGMAILLISSDMPELLAACDRILVMRRGETVASFDRGAVDQFQIGLAATGVQADLLAVADGEPVPKDSPLAPADARTEETGNPDCGVKPAPTGNTRDDPMPTANSAHVPVRPTRDFWGLPKGGAHRSVVQRILARREVALVAALLAIVVPLAFVNPRFVSGGNLSDLLLSTALIGIPALGQMLVMLTRNIDLSVASIIGLSAYVAASTISAHPTIPSLMIVALACAVGLLCGLINGLIVGYGRVPSIVVTLGTLAVYRGVDAILSDGKQVAASAVPDSWLGFTDRHILGVSILVWIALVLFLLLAGYLRWRSSGRDLYAAGSNPAGATQIGISVPRRIVVAFMLSGLAAGLAGALWASHYATVDGQLAYGLELTVIASVVVGGVALRGGSGTVLGVALGTFGLLVIQNALALARVNPQYLQAVYGAAILLAVSVDVVLVRRSRKRQLTA